MVIFDDVVGLWWRSWNINEVVDFLLKAVVIVVYSWLEVIADFLLS